MTETERMKQGYIWEDDDENIALQAKCKTLVRKFNKRTATGSHGRTGSSAS